jgi:hypothetical protein
MFEWIGEQIEKCAFVLLSGTAGHGSVIVLDTNLL